MTGRVLASFVDEMNKIGAVRLMPRLRAAGRWAGKEILAPALPTAVLAVLANEAVTGVGALRDRLVSPSVPAPKKKKKRKKRA